MQKKSKLLIAALPALFASDLAQAAIAVSTANSPVTITFDADVANVVQVSGGGNQLAVFESNAQNWLTPRGLRTSAFATKKANESIYGLGTNVAGYFVDGNNDGDVDDGFNNGPGLKLTPHLGAASNLVMISGVDDWTTSAVYLRIQNTTGATVSNWKIGFELHGAEANSDVSTLNYGFAVSNSLQPGSLSYTSFGSHTMTNTGSTAALSLDATEDIDVAAVVPDGGYLVIALTETGVNSGSAIYLDNLSVTALASNNTVLTLDNPAPVLESVGTATVSVSRVGSSGAVSVDYATADDSATAGDDYTTTTGTLSWADGDTSSKTISIPIINDAVFEPNETLSVTLSNPGGGATLSTSSVSLTILNDDAGPGSFSFSAAATPVAEAVGTAAITVSRSDSGGAVTVDYVTADVTATAGDDYTASSGTLTWADGDSTAKTINVPITNDSLAEPQESFTITLSNETGGASLGTFPETTVLINDDDAPPSVSLLGITFDEDSPGFYQARTGSGYMKAINEPGAWGVSPYNPSKSSCLLSNRVAISHSFLTGWTGNGQGSPTRFASDCNNNGSTAEDDPIPDRMRVVRPDESSGAGLASNAFRLSGETGNANDFAVNAVYFRIENTTGAPITQLNVGADIFYAEADANNFSDLTFSYAIDDGVDPAAMTFTSFGTAPSIAQGMTLSASPAGQLNETLAIPGGIPAGGHIVLRFGDDTTAAGSVIFLDNLSVTAPLPNNTVLTLDAPAPVLESVGTATVSVTRVGSSGAVSVDYATADDSATAGDDYTTTTGTLSWADGDTSSKTISIPIVNDAVFEPNETLSVTLSNPGGGATLGTASVSLTINNDDAGPGSFSFSAASSPVAEAVGTAVIAVSRSDSGGAVTVDYATADVTATAGVDYTASSGTLSWADGDSTAKIINVPITNDSLVEAQESFTITLSSATGGASLGAFPVTTILINDDDATPSVSLLGITFDADAPDFYQARTGTGFMRTITEPNAWDVNPFNPDKGSCLLSNRVACSHSFLQGWDGIVGASTRFADDANNNGFSDEVNAIITDDMRVVRPDEPSAAGLASNAYRLSGKTDGNNDYAVNAVYFRIENTTAATITQLNVGADIFYAEPDANNFSNLTFSYAIDSGVDPAAMTFTPFGTAPAIVQGMTLSASPAGQLNETLAIPGGIPAGGHIVLRFGDDSPGAAGSVIFLDNLSVTTPIPSGGGENYASWATDNGITGQPFDGDFDKDGISNGVEYALGLNPTTASGSPGVATNGGMTITFTKGADAKANGDVTYVIETSIDLGLNDDWTTAIAPDVTQTPDLISITFPSGNQKNFARLRVNK